MAKHARRRSETGARLAERAAAALEELARRILGREASRAGWVPAPAVARRRRR